MHKKIAGLIFAGILLAGTAFGAEVVVRVAPPRVVVETRGRPPSREHVWINGYHRWDGNAYHWEAGRWERPPRAHAHWVQHRWVHRRDGYVFVEGHWS